MQLSAFLRTSRRNGMVAIFHALHPRPVFIDETSWDRFLAGEQCEEILDALTGAELLASEESDNIEHASVLNQSIMPDTMSILYLMLTKNCNFKCRQCFQPERYSKGVEKGGLMTKEIAHAAINQFVRHMAMSANEALEPQIQFYGGEPLLNWDVFVYSVEDARSRMAEGTLPKDLRLVVVTNGSLMTRERAAFLAMNGVSVGLSVDGPRQMNDRYRRLATGGGTYDLIKRALGYLQEAEALVSLSITITPAMAADLPGIVRWANDELGVSALSFNFIGDASLERLGEIEREAYIADVAKGMVAAHRVVRERGLFEDRMERKIGDFADGTFKYVDCGALGNQLVVNPDGSVAYCHATSDYLCGDVFDETLNIFEVMREHPWRDALPIHSERCRDCPAISVCGYGCFHHAIDRGLPVDEGDDVHCSFTKVAMDYIVWSLYEKTASTEAV